VKDLRKNLIVYLMLGLSWPAIVAWLVYEHNKVVDLAQQGLLNRARDKSDMIALLSRSGVRGFGFIRGDRLEEALTKLTEPGDASHPNELLAVALLNANGDPIVVKGQSSLIGELPAQGWKWEQNKLTVVNPVDWGTSATLILDSGGEGRPGGPGGPGGPDGRNGRPGPPPPPDETAAKSGDRPTTGSTPNPADERGGRGSARERGGGPGPNRDRGPGGRGGRGGDGGGGRGGPMSGIRPFWMSEAQYKELIQKSGLHYFVLVLSTAKVAADSEQDYWLRTFIAGLALLSVGGLALGWRNLEKSTRLQMRLVRAHELNTHLQEMNLSAAGLAHETRNPLNIVRGLAQMISQHAALPGDIRERSLQITEEVDRVTVRLNEFINYSRPPEPRLGPANLAAIVRDVERTLESDTTEKGIAVELSGPELTVVADESLLRQVLFNLLLNATQAVGEGGRIAVSIAAAGRGEAVLSIEDNGPGVPENQREEIFRPYFTTNTHGSGLGLAVVKQIVLAHHWEIEYVRSGLGGAGFRVSGLRVL
jgi:signal transduction histidine kinase